MEKLIWEPDTMIFPVPVVMVSCGLFSGEHNIITVAWTGTINSDPAMCYISIRPERYSYEIINKTREFVINLATKDLVYVTDWCGIKSGRYYNKFTETGLTPVPAVKTGAPLIKESPLNIECKVKEIKELGSHHMFISEVVAINASEKFFEEKTGIVRLNKAGLICYLHGKYYETGNYLGEFGFSLKKNR